MWQQFPYTDADGRHSYFVYTPRSYKVAFPAPLIVMLHGCTQTAENFATATSMNLLAEQCGFIVLYPQQTSIINPRRCWNWFLPENQRRSSGEPARIVGMINGLRRDTTRWTIDPTRIYVAGLSAGASMAVILGATYPDLFAAIGVHSGLAYQAATNVRSAFQAMRRGGPDPLQLGRAAYMAMGNYSRIVPVIVFHGTNDLTVVPANGDQVARQWMQTNHLASNQTAIGTGIETDIEIYAANYDQPTQVTVDQVVYGHSYIRASWYASNGDEVQSYWKIAGMGHAWSGGDLASLYTDPRGPNATMEMYKFFMAHPMRRMDRQNIVSRQIRLRYPHLDDAV